MLGIASKILYCIYYIQLFKSGKMPYYVYVIKLDKEVLTSRKFRERNANLNPRKACYYVGQSCRDSKTRFQQHKMGYKSNHFAKKYGLKLSKRKYQRYNPINTRNEAERIEKELADYLRKKGHGVWSN